MNEARFEGGITDIIMPAPPAAIGAHVLLWIALAAVVAVITWFVWHRRTSRARARRRLRKLQKAHDRRSMPVRALAYRLAVVLRVGLNVPQLSDQLPLPTRIAARRERWRGFVDALASARYAPQPCSDAQLRHLFAEARFWMRVWP